METNDFFDVETVISAPLKFKAKLAIGEEAYGTLRIKNKISEYWDNYGWAATGATVAKSTVVASTFFAPSGVLGLLGIGTAVTPVGWVVAAAVLTGGAAIGVRRFLNDTTKSRVDTIPKFINTPIDILAINLFDLIAPLALKIADVDGKISASERKWIKNYFISEWGYDKHFLNAGIRLLESRLAEFSIKDIADKLAEFSKANPDCNYPVMTRDLIEFLKGVMEADGVIDEREEFAVEKIESIFKEAGSTFTKANLVKASGNLFKKIKTGVESVSAMGQVAAKNTENFVKSQHINRAANTAKSESFSAVNSVKNTPKV